MDLQKDRQKLFYESSIHYAYGLSYENKSFAERGEEEKMEGLNRIMQMSFKKKFPQQHESKQKKS